MTIPTVRIYGGVKLDMKTKDMKLLIDVSRCGSFSDVARDRCIDPSAVSRAVGDIEGKLGFQVFQRGNRRIALTEAGESYLHRIEWILEQLQQARDDAAAMSAGPGGILRMRATVGFGQRVIVPLMPKFRATYPKVNLDLILSDSELDLMAERIDLAVSLETRLPRELVGTKLLDTRCRVCASPAYLKHHDVPVVPAAVSDHKCLLLRRSGFRARWRFMDAEGHVSEVDVGGTVIVSGALEVHSLALAGLGPALLPDWLVADDIAQGHLIDLFPAHRVSGGAFETAVWLLHPSRACVPRKVGVMIDFLRDELRPKPAEASEESAAA